MLRGRITVDSIQLVPKTSAVGWIRGVRERERVSSRIVEDH